MTPATSGNTPVIASVGNYVYAGAALQTTLRGADRKYRLSDNREVYTYRDQTSSINRLVVPFS